MSLPDRLPTFRRFGSLLGATCRRVACILWKWSFRALFVLFCLVTLLALVIAEENFRGRRAWENYKQAALARGVKLTLAELAPPPVPDDQNFFMAPLLKPYTTDTHYWLDLSLDLPGKPDMPDLGYWQNGQVADLAAWRGYYGQADILSVLKKYAAKLDEISAAAQRPYARYPVDYDTAYSGRAIMLGTFFLVPMSNTFELRALSELNSGQPDSALADTLTLFQFVHATQGYPFLITQLTSEALLNRALQVVWEGLIAHRWNDAQLAALQAEIPRVNLLPGLQRSMQGEQAQFVDTYERLADINFFQGGREIKTSMDNMRHGFGGFFFYQNMLNLNLYYNQYVFPAFDVTTQRFYPQISQAGKASLGSMGQSDSYPLLYPYHALMGILTPTLNQVLVSCARAQTELDEASVACALERFRLAQGHYPDSLDTLVPQFIVQLPHDVISGGPLHYQRTADGRFLLYSVGWNETDDHGLVVKGKDGEIDRTQGDWVWPNPAH
jgi:hypothetical protein